jgi:hypothetical protein
MNLFRCVLAGSALLLGGLTSARGQGKILVSGEPPLTQEVVDLYQEMWEWCCDVKLTVEQRKEHTRLFVAFWKKSGPDVTQARLEGYGRMEKEWRGIMQLKGAEQRRKRLQVKQRWLGILRKAKDDAPGQLLLTAYDAAYKPGGSKNPVVVAGNPPLGKVTIDHATVYTEWLLDRPLTDEQRKENQRFYIAAWKQWGREKKEKERDAIAWLADLLQQASAYDRHYWRAIMLPKKLTVWGKEGAEAESRWRLGLYREASKPGSKDNPILVEGKPALTQELVDRYGDYIEIMLDLSVSGGLTDAQRRDLQDYLVKDWKGMAAATKEGIVADLKVWADGAGRGVGEANKQVGSLRPRLLAQLETAGGQRSKWLLGIAARERKMAEALGEAERQRHKAAMRLIDNLRPTGSWRFDPVKGRYEWRP